MLHASLSVLSATASPPCTLNIPAHNVHYDLRGVPGVSGAYSGASDRSVNEGLAEASSKPTRRAGREGRGMMAVLILGAVAVGVGVWRVALSKSHW